MYNFEPIVHFKGISRRVNFFERKNATTLRTSIDEQIKQQRIKSLKNIKDSTSDCKVNINTLQGNDATVGLTELNKENSVIDLSEVKLFDQVRDGNVSNDSQVISS